MVNSVTLAITGASGAPYALTLLNELLHHEITINLLISDAAREVFRIESGIELPKDKKEIELYFMQGISSPKATLKFFHKKDWLSPAASGSNAADAMVICPCSMGTLSAISLGSSNNLIERAADVTLKENKQLIILPREMPLSQIHLENMLRLKKMGVTIMPASPGFYQQPKTVQDLVDFVVARILDQLHLPQNLLQPWGVK
ncbi:MAG: UbiX family flavin prenyltransferase [Gammaproteobacteria bacterium]|nr:UbiX family flavin prenyltransferase [Gammaproteobacteria bacterium]